MTHQAHSTPRQHIMANKEHTEILTAYLSRLIYGDHEAINKAVKNWELAWLTRGNKGQMNAYNDLRGTIAKAIDNMLPHDVENISKVLAKTVRATP
jgi:hypothetical protein